MLKAFRYKLYPTPPQAQALEQMLETCRHLYNRCLAERRDAWQNEGNSLNYYDQAHQLKDRRKQNEDLAKVNFSATQGVLRRLDKAFQAFFRRVKAGEAPGYPRFKSKGRYDSITFPLLRGWMQTERKPPVHPACRTSENQVASTVRGEDQNRHRASPGWELVCLFCY
jgi:transposase